MPIVINATTIQTDKDGYLSSLNDWNPEVAEALALAEGITLNDQHWAVITALQAFYQQFEIAPAMRILVKHIKSTLGEEKGNSIYLMQLFPPSPAKIAAKIAGLPRPTNCL